jgi:hypothetical protein
MMMGATSFPILYSPILNVETLVSPEPALEVNPKPEKKCKIRTGFHFGRVCMRSGPGTDFAPCATVGEGQQIDLLDMVDPFWIHVRAYGIHGYILARYVDFNDPEVHVTYNQPASS